MQLQPSRAFSPAGARCMQQPHAGARCVCNAVKPNLQPAQRRSSCCSLEHNHEGNSSLLPSFLPPGVAAAMCAVGTAAGSAAAETAAAATTAVSTAADFITPVDPSTYVPGPVEVGWQIWFAAFVSTWPFVIGAYEFGKRILIQRLCKVCNGSGLVVRGKGQRKCPECGGFFPWISWRMFLSANARPGNGGPLLQPRGQTSVFYTVPPPPSVDAASQAAPGAASAAATAAQDQNSTEQTTGRVLNLKVMPPANATEPCQDASLAEDAPNTSCETS